MSGIIKSATKKRLMDLGIAEDMATKLSRDRKWADVRTLHLDDIQSIIGGSQFSAMVIYLRIHFRVAILDFFREVGEKTAYDRYGDESAYVGMVAMPRSRSSLAFREDMGSGVIINRRTLGIGQHDYDLVMDSFRSMVPTNWIKMVNPVNGDWYPEYYEEWVQNQRRTQEEALQR